MANPSFKWHLSKVGNGGKAACGRGQGNSHYSTTWSEFKNLPEGHYCEACMASKQANLNKRNEAKKEQEMMVETISEYVPENSKRAIAALAAKVAAKKQ